MVFLEKLLKKLGSFDDIDLEAYVPDLNTHKLLAWTNGQAPYFVIDNLFTETYAHELKNTFDTLLEHRGYSEKPDREKFSKLANYDAYIYTPMPDILGPLRVFYSREWYTFFEKKSGRHFDENVMTALHHHKTQSENGYIHTDFGLYAFRHHTLPNQLNHWFHNSIYQTHKNPETLVAQKDIFLTRRAVALIYYLDTEEWQEGDGGETGFFQEKESSDPFLKIAPKFNRLLVFQINRSSFHAFIKNTKCPRNTIIQWFHEPFDMPKDSNV